MLFFWGGFVYFSLNPINLDIFALECKDKSISLKYPLYDHHHSRTCRQTFRSFNFFVEIYFPHLSFLFYVTHFSIICYDVHIFAGLLNVFWDPILYIDICSIFFTLSLSLLLSLRIFHISFHWESLVFVQFFIFIFAVFCWNCKIHMTTFFSFLKLSLFFLPGLDDPFVS